MLRSRLSGQILENIFGSLSEKVCRTQTGYPDEPRDGLVGWTRLS
jgi:hypothetical protein